MEPPQEQAKTQLIAEASNDTEAFTVAYLASSESADWSQGSIGQSIASMIGMDPHRSGGGRQERLHHTSGQIQDSIKQRNFRQVLPAAIASWAAQCEPVDAALQLLENALELVLNTFEGAIDIQLKVPLSAPGGSQELGTDATMMTVMSLSASPSAPSSATMLAMGPEIREPIVQPMDAVSTMHTCPLMVGMLCGDDHMAVHKGLVCRSAKIPCPLPQLSSFTGHWYCRHEPWNLCARLRHGTVPLHLSRDASREPCGPPPHQSAVV